MDILYNTHPNIVTGILSVLRDPGDHKLVAFIKKLNRYFSSSDMEVFDTLYYTVMGLFIKLMDTAYSNDTLHRIFCNFIFLKFGFKTDVDIPDYVMQLYNIDDDFVDKYFYGSAFSNSKYENMIKRTLYKYCNRYLEKTYSNFDALDCFIRVRFNYAEL